MHRAVRIRILTSGVTIPCAFRELTAAIQSWTVPTTQTKLAVRTSPAVRIDSRATTAAACRDPPFAIETTIAATTRTSCKTAALTSANRRSSAAVRVGVFQSSTTATLNWIAKTAMMKPTVPL